MSTPEKTPITLLEKLRTDGVLDQLLCFGLMPVTILEYRDLYLHYDMLIKTESCTKAQAALRTASVFSVDVKTVYRAVTRMEQRF